MVKENEKPGSCSTATSDEEVDIKEVALMGVAHMQIAGPLQRIADHVDSDQNFCMHATEFLNLVTQIVASGKYHEALELLVPLSDLIHDDVRKVKQRMRDTGLTFPGDDEAN